MSKLLDALLSGGKGLAEFSADTAASMISPAYKENLIGRNRMIRDEELRQRDMAFVDEQIGTRATQQPYDNITQELFREDNPQAQMPVNEIAGTGYEGGQLTKNQLAGRLLAGGHRPSTRVSGGSILNKLLTQQKVQQAQHYMQMGAPGGQRTNAVYDPATQQTTAIGRPWQQQAGVQVHTGQPVVEGRMYSQDEALDMGLSSNSRWWNDGRGGMPKKVGNYSEQQVKSASAVNSMMQASKGMEALVADGYQPTDSNSMDQLGMNGAVANFFRAPQGQEFLSYQNMWIDTYLALTSGADVTEKQRQNAISTYGFSTFDSPSALQNKQQLRAIAEGNLATRSGGAYKNLYGPQANQQQQPAANKPKVINWEDLPSGY